MKTLKTWKTIKLTKSVYKPDKTASEYNLVRWKFRSSKELFTFLVDQERIFQDSSNIQPRIYQHVFQNIINSWWTYDKIYRRTKFPSEILTPTEPLIRFPKIVTRREKHYYFDIFLWLDSGRFFVFLIPFLRGFSFWE